MRLSIRVEDKYLDLFENTSIQIDAQSPVYFGDRASDAIPGIKTYSFSIPSTAANRIALDRPELLDNPNDFISISDCRIFFDSNLILFGTARVKVAPKMGPYTVQFIGGLAGNLTSLKEQFLTELSFDGNRTLGSDQATALTNAKTVAQNPDTNDYNFPMVKIAASAEDKYEYVNHYHNDAFFKSTTIDTVDTYSTLVPMAKLSYVLEHIFDSVGYKLSGVFSDHEYKDELNRLLIFNNQSLDTTSSTLENPTVDAYSLKLIFNLKEHLPRITINNFIKAVCFTFNWTPFIRPQQNSIFLADNNRLLNQKARKDWTNKVDPRYTKEEKIQNIITTFCYEHSSDDDSDLPSSLDGVGELFEVNTLSDLPQLTVNEAGRLYYILSLNKYYDFLGIRPVDQEVYKLRAQIFRCNVDDQVDVIAFNTNTLFMINKAASALITNQSPESESTAMLPLFYSDIVSLLYGSIDRITDIPLIFYRGIVQDANGDNYPMANNTNYNLAESDAYNLSLLINGPKGIYQTWWKDWMEAIQKMVPVTFTTRLTANDLEQLDFSKKVRIDKHSYFIKRVRVTLTTREIRPAIVEYMKIN